jgi:hypothetical protein
VAQRQKASTDIPQPNLKERFLSLGRHDVISLDKNPCQAIYRNDFRPSAARRRNFGGIDTAFLYWEFDEILSNSVFVKNNKMTKI